MSIPFLITEDRGLYATFGTTAAVAITQYQMVAFGASDDLITGTSDANLCIGFAMKAVASGDAGPTNRIQVRLNGNAIMLAVGNGTVTRGAQAVATGTAGKVTNAGATPDARTVVGRFMASNAVDGDFVPVLIA